MTGSERMWSLEDFRFDEAIVAAAVQIFGDPYLGEVMAREEAIAHAHRQGANLVASRPSILGEEVTSCVIAKVTLPLRWERAPLVDPPPIDERLWFDCECGNRAFILGNAHTHVGRMRAWCPQDGVEFNVSFDEMATMSDESRYFIAGFLAGSEPDCPFDADDRFDGSFDAPDVVAWRSATARFRRTGTWNQHWETCQVCGCVLLPGTTTEHCYEHSPQNAAGSTPTSSPS